MNGVKILRPGMLSLIEDGGRPGYGAIGITPGGPADRYSARWANHLLGNRPEAPVVEITLGGMVFEALGDLRIALTGAEAPLTINGDPRPLWHTHTLARGDRIEIGMAARGLRLYLAAEGGWRCSRVLGSCAVTVREQLGRPLEAGDLLEASSPAGKRLSAFVPEQLQRTFPSKITLRILESYHHARFSAKARERFYAQRFRVTTATDRMGCRLSGEAIDYPGEIISEPTTLGAVQIPADGQPIVLMAEHQTIGGYPIIGTVLPCDLDRLAQAQPGSRVRFSLISLVEARQLAFPAANCPPRCSKVKSSTIS